jgi:hypothetical protein
LPRNIPGHGAGLAKQANSFPSKAKAMPIEFLHATLGIVFTCIWLAIGQIIVGVK